MGPPADHDLDERPHGVIRVLTLGHSVEKKMKLRSWVGVGVGVGVGGSLTVCSFDFIV